jgi:hypothetical protein
MATEIQQKPNLGDEQSRQSNQSSGDALRPPLEDIQAYGNHKKQNTLEKGDFKTSQTDLSKGSLTFTPIAGFDKATDKTGHSKTDEANGVADAVKDTKGEGASKESKASGESKKSNNDDANNISDKAGDTNGNDARAQSDKARSDKMQSDKANNSKSDDASSAGKTIDKKDDKENLAKQSTDKTKDTNEAPVIPENQEIALNPETQKAKDDFVKILEDRFKDDPRLPELEARMDKMDQRVLHERVKCDDGSFIDQQEQLANVYKNLSRIGTDAEKLTYTADDGKETQVYGQPSMVNNILGSAIVRGADPTHFYNQGANNTCAAESINRQGNELLAGDDSKTIADMVTKGEFKAVDNNGKSFTCKVDRKSLCTEKAYVWIAKPGVFI